MRVRERDSSHNKEDHTRRGRRGELLSHGRPPQKTPDLEESVTAVEMCAMDLWAEKETDKKLEAKDAVEETEIDAKIEGNEVGEMIKAKAEMGEGAVGLHFQNLDSTMIKVKANGVGDMSMVSDQGQKHSAGNKGGVVA